MSRLDPMNQQTEQVKWSNPKNNWGRAEIPDTPERSDLPEIHRKIEINRKCAALYREKVASHLRGDSPYGIDIMIRDKVTEVTYTPEPNDMIGRYCTPIFMGMADWEFKKGIASVFSHYVKFSDDRKKIMVKV